MAESLDRATRSNETLARYGGEEFSVLLEDIKPGGMIIMGERLRSAVEHLEINFEGQVIPITVSIGIATGRRNRWVCQEFVFALWSWPSVNKSELRCLIPYSQSRLAWAALKSGQKMERRQIASRPIGLVAVATLWVVERCVAWDCRAK